jgi:hypothetical protein
MKWNCGCEKGLCLMHNVYDGKPRQRKTDPDADLLLIAQSLAEFSAAAVKAITRLSERIDALEKAQWKL